MVKQKEIKIKYPEARVDLFVNSYDSSFSINNIEDLLEDEED